MTENPKHDDRTHPEAPAEGDRDADPSDGIRVHPQDPAEGVDGAGEPSTGEDT